MDTYRVPVGQSEDERLMTAKKDYPRSVQLLNNSTSETSEDSELIQLRIEEAGDEITDSRIEPVRSNMRPVLNGASLFGLPAEVAARESSVSTDALITLIEAIDEGIYDPITATFVDQFSGQRMRLSEAINKGLVNVDNIKVVVSTSGASVPMNVAMETGVLDVQLGQVYDPHTGRKVMFDLAVEKGLISEVRTVSTLEELYKQGKYDAVSGMVTDPCTGAPLPLMAAIERGVVDRASVRIHEPISGDSLTITEAFQRGIMDPDTGNVIDGRTGASVTFQVAVCKCLVVGEQSLQRTRVTIDGIEFDAQTSDVIDPKSGEPVGFTQALREKIVDSQKYCVLNTSTNEKLPLLQALKSHLVDAISGEVIDTASGQPFSFKDALQLGLVVNRSEKSALTQAIEAGSMTAGTRILDPSSKEYVTVLSAIKSGLFNPDSGAVRDSEYDISLEDALEQRRIVTCPGRVSLCDALQSGIYDEGSRVFIGQGCGNRLTLEDCIAKSIINANLPELIDTASGRTMTISEAIDRHILDPERCEVTDTKSGSAVSFLDAVAKNIIIEEGPQQQRLPRNVEAISLVDAIERGIYTPQSNTVVHPVTGQTTSIAQALDSGFIKAELAVVQDSLSGQQVPLQSLFEMNLIDLRRGTLRDQNGKAVPLDDAVRTGLLFDVRPSVEPYSLIQLFDKGLYNCRTGEFLDPSTDEVITMEDVLGRGILNPTSVVINDPGSSEVLSLAESIKHCLVDVKTSLVRDTSCRENIPLTEALYRGIIIPRPMPIATAVEIGLFNESTAKFLDPTCRQFFVLEEAIEHGLIDSASSIVDPATGKEIALALATACGVLDAKHGNVINVHTGDIVSLKEAFALSRLLPKKDGITLDEAVRRNLYNPANNRIIDPNTKELHTLDEAIHIGIIDSQSYVRDPATGQRITLAEAIALGVLDMQTGQVLNLVSQEWMSLTVAACEPPISLPEAVKRQVYKPDENTVVDTYTSDVITLQKALDLRIIDPRSLLRSPTSLEVVTIESAVRSGLCNVSSGTVANRKTGENVALKNVLVIAANGDSSVPVMMSLAVAVREGLYDAVTNTIRHPDTGNEFTVEESLNEGIVDRHSKVKEPHSGVVMTLQEAMESGMIDPNMGILIDTVVGREIPLKEALNHGLLVDSSVPSRPLTVTEAVRRGLFDESSGTFLNPASNRVLSLTEAVGCNFITTDDFRIVSNSPRSIMGYDEAIEKSVLDPDKGTVLEEQTSAQLPVSLAVAKGIIVDTEMIFLRPKDVNEYGLYDVHTGELTDPSTGDTISFIEAIERRLLDPDAFIVKHPKTGELMAVEEAINNSILDADTGSVIDPRTGKIHQLNESIACGFIVDSRRETCMTLGEAVEKNIYDAERGVLKDPLTGSHVTLLEAIRLQLIDPSKTDLNVPWTKGIVTLKEAIANGLVDPLSGTLTNPQTRETMSLTAALQKERVTGSSDGVRQDTSKTKKESVKKQTMTLTEASERRLLGPDDGSVLDPVTGKQMMFVDAIQSGVIDASHTIVHMPDSDDILTLDDAKRRGIIDVFTGCVIDPNSGKSTSLADAVATGLIEEMGGLSLQEAFTDGTYSPDLGSVVDPMTGEAMTLTEALFDGVIDVTSSLIKEPDSGRIVSLEDAIDCGTFDTVSGAITDSRTGQRIPCGQAVNDGLVKNAKQPQLRLQEAVKAGLYDCDSGLMTDLRCGTQVTLKAAIQCGLIDPVRSFVNDPASGVRLSLENAVTSGLVDAEAGKMRMSETDELISLLDVNAIGRDGDTGGMVSMSMYEALERDIFDEDTGKVVDPSSGQHLTIIEAIETGMIEPDSIKVKHPESRQLLSFQEAIDLEVMDPRTGDVLSPDGETLTLKEAVHGGLALVPSKASGFSLIDAVQQGLYNPDTGKITDPWSGREMSLQRSIVKGLIDPSTDRIQSGSSGEELTIDEAQAGRLIDLKTGKVTEPQSGKCLSLGEAIMNDLLVYAKDQSISLAEAVEKGVFDEGSGKVIRSDVNNGQPMTIREALDLRIIDPSKTVIRDPGNGQMIALDNAIDIGLVSESTGKFLDCATGATRTITEAVSAGLVFDANEPAMLSLTHARQLDLIDPRTGFIVEPITGELMSVKEAIHEGLIDPTRSVLILPSSGYEVAIEDAIAEGLVDPVTGAVRCQLGKDTLLTDAIATGVIVSSDPPAAVNSLSSGAFTRRTPSKAVKTQETLQPAVNVTYIENEGAPISNKVCQSIHYYYSMINLTQPSLSLFQCMCLFPTHHASTSVKHVVVILTWLQ